MNTTQKIIAALGLVAVVVTSFFAPYAYRAHWVITRIQGYGTSASTATGTVYAPLWSPPRFDPHASWLPMGKADFTELDDVHLDAGRLGLWWGGIAMISVVGVVLAATSSKAQGQRKPEPAAPPSTPSGFRRG